MPRSATFDPLDRFRWRIFVVSPSGAVFARAGFTTCSTPSVNIAYKSYAEGGRHMNPRKVHDNATFTPITLTRGVIAKPGVDDFALWMAAAYTALAPEPKEATPQYRNDIVIEQLDRDANVVKRWFLRNCVPSSYKPASDFSASDDSGMSIETLTFEYEGFEEERQNTLENVGDFVRRFTRGIF